MLIMAKYGLKIMRMVKVKDNLGYRHFYCRLLIVLCLMSRKPEAMKSSTPMSFDSMPISRRARAVADARRGLRARRASRRRNEDSRPASAVFSIPSSFR